MVDYNIICRLRRAWRSLYNGMFFSKFRRRLFYSPLSACLTRLFGRFYKIKERRVVFSSFSGAFDCNPKYVALEFKTKHPEWEMVFLLDGVDYRSRKTEVESLGFKCARMWTLSSLIYIATARIWVENAKTFAAPGIPRKKRRQIYMNTWHGSLGIKKMTGVEAGKRLSCSSNVPDVVLTNSGFEDMVFSRDLFPSVKLSLTGHPRNDVFFKSIEDKHGIIEKVRAALSVPPGVRVALYAPTFQEQAFFSVGNDVDFRRWISALSLRFGGDWVIALRLHPHDAQGLAEGLFTVPPEVVNASDYDDMQELLLAVDVGITDYSSWIFDYLLTGRPAFIFAPDAEAYAAARGLYYPLSETPFPVAESESDLLANIAGFQEDEYHSRTEKFLSSKRCVEEGMSSARAVAEIEHMLEMEEVV